MAETPLSKRLQSADEAMLREILREAEVYLDAQLTAAIAADQRAYAFSGMIAAASVLLVGASYALIEAATPSPLLAWCSALIAVALFVAAWMAVISARSTDFEFAGNQPCQWANDIEAGQTLHESLAEQCEHYDSMATTNRNIMDANSKLFNAAVNIALGAVGVGGLGFIAWMAERV